MKKKKKPSAREPGDAASREGSGAGTALGPAARPGESAHVTFTLKAAEVRKPAPRPARGQDPVPGTAITRRWRGRDYLLIVHADGYELEGKRYRTLSAAAKGLTGSHWNGRLFFGLKSRKRKPG